MPLLRNRGILATFALSSLVVAGLFVSLPAGGDPALPRGSRIEGEIGRGPDGRLMLIPPSVRSAPSGRPTLVTVPPAVRAPQAGDRAARPPAPASEVSQPATTGADAPPDVRPAPGHQTGRVATAPSSSGWFLSEAVADTNEYDGVRNGGAAWGTNGTYYHTQAQLAWVHPGGDWLDAHGVAQGSADFATVTSEQDGRRQQKTADVTALLKSNPPGVQPEVMLVHAGGGLRFISSRYDPMSNARPSISVSYADGSAETLSCRANVSLDRTTMAPQVGKSPPYQLRFGAMNIALRFNAANPTKAITRATLSFDIQAQQFSGPATLHVRKVLAPFVTNKVELGVANNVTDDAGLGAQPGVIYFADFSSGNFSDYFAQPPFIDYTNGNSLDYTGKNSNKLPLVVNPGPGKGRFLSPTDKLFAGYPRSDSGPKPVFVDGSYDAYGYKPLAPGSPYALRWDNVAGQGGAMIMADFQYYFRTTDTGNQSHPFVDGETIPLRATHDIVPAFSTRAGSKTITVRDPSHGANVGDWVRIPDHVSVGGVILGGGLIDWYKITSVPDADHYTFDLWGFKSDTAKSLSYKIVSNVATYGFSGQPNLPVGGMIKIENSADPALNGSWTVTSASYGSSGLGYQFMATFNVTAPDAAATADAGATVTIVPNATVHDAGVTAMYTFSGLLQSAMTVTLPYHGFIANPTDHNHAYNSYSARSATNVGGIDVGPLSSYTVSNITQDTFTIAPGRSRLPGSAAAANGGKVEFQYASGNPLPAGRLPSEMYVRWYQLLGTDFYLSPDGFGPNNAGKWGLGFAHRTTLTGNGGACGSRISPIVGKAGWSARNQHKEGTIPEDPTYHKQILGTYQYNSDNCQTDFMYAPGAAILDLGRWYCIEVHMKLNTIDRTDATSPRADGILEAWIDGRKVFRKTDFLWRSNPPWMSRSSMREVPAFADQGIEFIWWNVYFGGVGQWMSHPMHFFFKNVTISNNYVGPMRLSAEAVPRRR